MPNDIFLEINGIRYEGWQSVNVSKSIEHLSGQFSFESSVKEVFLNNQRFIENPIKAQDEARIFIDDNLIITGTVEELNIAYSSDSHGISVSGRDKTGDLIDSSAIQKSYNINNFPNLIRLVLSDNGYADIKVKNDVFGLKALGSSEKIKTEAGDTVFSFLDRYAKKLQVLLNTDADGNIIITREGSTDAGGVLLSTKNNPNNNIFSANLSINTKQRYRFVEVYSQADNKSYGVSAVSQKGAAEDDIIRAPRRIRINSSNTTTSDFLNDLAKWNVNVKRAKGQRYSARVVGYYADQASNTLWQPNTLVQVLDDKCNLDGSFLIQGVSYTKSSSGGSFTDLSIVNQGAFSLSPVSTTTSNLAEDLIKSGKLGV
jgi:prophage tail gpP-like protein